MQLKYSVLNLNNENEQVKKVKKNVLTNNSKDLSLTSSRSLISGGWKPGYVENPLQN